MSSKEKPYVLLVAELIYFGICEIKKKNSKFSNINAIETFIGSKTYKEVSSGKFHNTLIEKLKKNNFIDPKTKKKVPEETIKLLEIQKDLMVKQLIQFPDLYYAKVIFHLKYLKEHLITYGECVRELRVMCMETKQNKFNYFKNY